MAELKVQPKSKTPWWLWLILLIVALAVLFYFMRGFGNQAGEHTTIIDSTATTDSTTITKTATTYAGFDSVDFDAPKTSFPEITDTTITVRGGNKYTIYSLGENVLFAKGQSTLQSKASNQLNQIAASLQKRLNGSVVGIYGHADSSGDADMNQQLAEKRAEAVRKWLVTNSSLDSTKVYVRSYGETEPVATNATAKGRQLNRSVEIVAVPDSIKRN